MSIPEIPPPSEQSPARDLLHHPYLGQRIKRQAEISIRAALQKTATAEGATLTKPEGENTFVYARHLTENQRVVKADAGENVPLTATNIYDAEGFLLWAQLERHTTASAIPTVERVYQYSEVDTEGFKTVTGIDIYVKDAAGNMTLVTQKRVGADGETQEKSFPNDSELGSLIDNVMSTVPIPNKIAYVDSLLKEAQDIAAKDQTGMVRFNQTSPTTAEVVIVKPHEMANVSEEFGHNYIGDYMWIHKIKAKRDSTGKWIIEETDDDFSLWASTEKPKFPYKSQKTTYTYRPDGLLDSNTTELGGKRTVTEKYLYNRQLQLSSGQEIQVFDTNHVYYDEEGQHPTATGSFTFLNDVLLPSRFAYANPQARNNLGIARQGFSDVILENKLIRIIPFQASGEILIVTLQLDTKGEIVRDPADTYFTVDESGTIVPQKAATVELIG